MILLMILRNNVDIVVLKGEKSVCIVMVFRRRWFFVSLREKGRE